MVRRSGLVSLAVLALAGCAVAPGDESSLGSSSSELAIRGGFLVPPASMPFTFKGVSGKCIDVGPAPWIAHHAVYLYDCNGTDAQKIGVLEVDAATHQSKLTAGGLCIGAKGDFAENGYAAWFPLPGAALELQPCSDAALAQRFVLDGDSVVLATMPTLAQSSYRERLVAEAQSGMTKRLTPIVLGTRDMDDEEIFAATSADPSSPAAQPNGFCNVSSLGQLKNALARPAGTTPCTVVTLTQSLSLSPQDTLGIAIPAGTTIRGGRKGLARGASITYPTDALYQDLFDVAGDDVRITGLALSGPWGAPMAGEKPSASGVVIPPGVRAIVDHCEMSSWSGAAVDVKDDASRSDSCPASLPTPQPVIHVVRNYIHGNGNDELGYGVAVRMATVGVRGNTFQGNRHSITAAYDAHSSYAASGNLVLPGAPPQVHVGITWFEQDFDMHGSGWSLFEGDWHGGVAGGWYDIAFNTFLGNVEPNIKVRGTPCVGVWYHDNVSLRSQGDSLDVGDDTKAISQWSNTFSIFDPTIGQQIGDFDGDGLADRFIATGAGWYVSSANKTEWRLLRENASAMYTLTFRDYDGDGRMDVLYGQGSTLCVSYGGTSGCDAIGTYTPPPPPSGGGGGGGLGGGGSGPGGGGTKRS